MPSPTAIARHALLAVGILLAVPGAGQAHVTKVSSSALEVAETQVSATIQVNGADLQAALPDQRFTDDDGAIDTAALAGHAEAVTAYLLDHARVTAGDEVPCAAEPGPPTVDDGHVLMTAIWTCSEAAGLAYRVTLFQDIDPVARHIVLVSDSRGQHQALIDSEHTRVSLTEARQPVWQVALRYVQTGIEHIFVGYDHIAFLIAVIAWGRRPWPLVKVVTAFTIAHSITLTLASLDIVSLPSAVAEALIAASIVYVAVENFFVRNIDKRWRVTFLLGLFHGFGFAGVLREYGLPSDSLAVSLASFNIGVEIGQVAIVLIAVPVLLAADRVLAKPGVTAVRQPVLVYSISALIGALGLYWVAARTIL